MKQQFLTRIRTISWANNFFPAFSSYPTAFGDTTEANAIVKVPPSGAGIARNLKIRPLTNTLAGGTAWTLLFRKNGSNTALACVMTPATGTNAVENTSDEISYAEDDDICLNIVPTGFPADFTFIVSYEYETASVYRSVYSFGHPVDQPSNASVEYDGVFSGSAHWEASATDLDIVGVSGTIIGLNARSPSNPGSGKSRTIDVMLGGAAQTGSVVVSDAEVFDKSTVSIPVMAGARVAMRHTPSGTPTAGVVIGALTFDSDTAYTFNFAGHCDSSPSTSAVNYFLPVGDMHTAVWTATEADVQLDAPITSLVLRNMRVVPRTIPPGASKSYDYTLRKDTGGGAADTAQTVNSTGSSIVIAGPSAGADVLFTNTEKLSLKSTPTGTPSSPSGVAWVFEGVVSPAGIIAAFHFGSKGTITSSRTLLANLDDTTRTVSAPGCLYLGGYFVLHEQSGAPTPIANTAIIYAVDNGSGKTRLMVQFPTGSPIQIEIEA